MSQIEGIKQAIMADPQMPTIQTRNRASFCSAKTARINIIGQAPGLKLKKLGFWKDKSGDRLETG